MKYRLLTKEQFEELHPEFINFLASQSIDKNEWDTLKNNKPAIAQQEMEVFSDLVWEGVLGQAKYLESHSPQQLFLFKISTSEMNLIVVKVTNDAVDISSKEGLEWLQSSLESDEVELFTASKTFSEDKNTDIFKLIEQGAEITKGEFYEAFSKVIG